jgi:hypothetical protein
VQYQARSAFAVVRFTPNESKSLFNYPVRIKILLILMLPGNVGIVTAIVYLILSFIRTNSEVFYASDSFAGDSVDRPGVLRIS